MSSTAKVYVLEQLKLPGHATVGARWKPLVSAIKRKLVEAHRLELLAAGFHVEELRVVVYLPEKESEK